MGKMGEMMNNVWDANDLQYRLGGGVAAIG
jgi:hypothetical protein